MIEIKRAAELGRLPAPWPERIGALLERAFARLERAHEASRLPAEAPDPEALEQWLIERRIAGLNRVPE